MYRNKYVKKKFSIDQESYLLEYFNDTHARVFETEYDRKINKELKREKK